MRVRCACRAENENRHAARRIGKHHAFELFERRSTIGVERRNCMSAASLRSLRGAATQEYMRVRQPVAEIGFEDIGGRCRHGVPVGHLAGPDAARFAKAAIQRNGLVLAREHVERQSGEVVFARGRRGNGANEFDDPVLHDAERSIPSTPGLP